MRDIIKHSWVRCATGQHSWRSDSLLAGKYKIFEREWRGTMRETGRKLQINFLQNHPKQTEGEKKHCSIKPNDLHAGPDKSKGKTEKRNETSLG